VRAVVSRGGRRVTSLTGAEIFTDALDRDAASELALRISRFSFRLDRAHIARAAQALQPGLLIEELVDVGCEWRTTEATPRTRGELGARTSTVAQVGG